MKANIIHYNGPPKGDIAYIVRGFLDYEVITYYPDGVGVGGGQHKWILGITDNEEKALKAIENLNDWLNGHLERHVCDFTDQNTSIYSGNGFNCPLDYKMTSFMNSSDSVYNFKRPWYVIEESNFLNMEL